MYNRKSPEKNQLKLGKNYKVFWRKKEDKKPKTIFASFVCMQFKILCWVRNKRFAIIKTIKGKIYAEVRRHRYKCKIDDGIKKTQNDK